MNRDVATGLLAGVAGTAAMDLAQYRRYRRDGGADGFWKWEFAAGVTSWDEAPAPGQLGRNIQRFVIRKQPPDTWAQPTTNLVHWATGAGWGVQYGALAGRTSRHPWLRALALGPAAWMSGYVVLPLAKVYEPIWRYDARTLGQDLSAHVVYGLTGSLAFWALARSDDRRSTAGATNRR